jgi:hypothetical protein
MRVAKLEMKLILATFLTGYEFDLVDKDGKFPDPLPVPDRNNLHQVRVGLWMRSPIQVLMFPSLAPLEHRPTSTSRRLTSRRAVTRSPIKSHPTPSPIPDHQIYPRRGFRPMGYAVVYITLLCNLHMIQVSTRTVDQTLGDRP